jgi:hypothetical protein
MPDSLASLSVPSEHTMHTSPILDSYQVPDKRGGLNKSTQHHLIEGCSLKVVVYEAGETVWIFCGREEQDLESLEGGRVAA